jgi:hypothetical protein
MKPRSLTNLGAAPTLVEEARQLGMHKTKTAAIRAALEEYVERHTQAPTTAGRRKRR